jgi:L-fuconolactonase
MEMINFPIVDTHLHIWEPGKKRIAYSWLENVPKLNADFTLAGYNEAWKGMEIESMVFIQCDADQEYYQEEADWVEEQAVMDPRIRGIVPTAPLEKADGVKSILEHMTANPRVKGIRRLIQFEEDINFCLRPDFVRGVQLLPGYNLSFDICISHIHMANTIKMVAQCPEVRFILDHIGKPDIKNQLLDPWKDELKTLAGFENVHCKMSGLVNEAAWENWKPADLKPYIGHVIECFGWDRVIFGGDWPVCLLSSPVRRWFDTLSDALSGCSDDELKKLFHDNAIAFYRL